MNLEALQEEFLKRLATELRRYGFQSKAADQAFYRIMPFGWWGFHLAFIPHDADFDVTGDVAIRVDKVENLVNADNKVLSRREKSETATIGAELGNIADHRQKRWTVASASDLESTARSLITEFAKFGIPYLERFSDLETMLEALADNQPSGWLHSPVHASRCKRAVALALVLGKKDRAAELAQGCETFLQSRMDPGLPSFKAFSAKQVRSG